MKIILAMALFFVPGMIRLGMGSWLAGFRTDAAVKDDSGVGNYLAAHRARLTPTNYTTEGRKYLRLLWLAEIVQLICLVAAVMILSS